VAIASACVGTAALGCPAERSSAEVVEHTVPRLPRSTRVDSRGRLPLRGSCT